MKHFIATVSVTFFLLCGFTSCKDKMPQPSEIAQEFLNAYFANDFTHAASFCNEEIASFIRSSANDFENLDPAVKKVIEDISSKLTYQITEVREVDKNNVIIEYEIITPESPMPVSSYLMMTKVEKRWLISQLNK